MKLKTKKLPTINTQDLGNGVSKNPKKKTDFFRRDKSLSYEKNDIRYVSRNQPCEICSKSDWCAYTVNTFGEKILALCQRNSNGSIKVAKDGSYIHILADANPRITSYVKSATKPLNPKANIQRCNSVYTAMLGSIQVTNEILNEAELSTLYTRHKDKLLERGLADDTIARNLYASVPEQSKGNELARELSRKFDLTGVPGFYRWNGDWQLNTYHKGYYVPYRNPNGLIFGIQIRLDIPIDKTKYVWLSSADKEMGSSSKSPLHFVNVNMIQATNEIYITEGALKADVIGELASVGVVAMAGVKNVKAEMLVEALRILFPELRRAVIAFDMDFQTNKVVEKALSEMETELQKWKGLEIETLVWDLRDGKGFDDYLLKVGENGK
jgi:hypothetical protein